LKNVNVLINHHCSFQYWNFWTNVNAVSSDWTQYVIPNNDMRVPRIHAQNCTNLKQWFYCTELNRILML
jgi:hypothetical protein